VFTSEIRDVFKPGPDNGERPAKERGREAPCRNWAGESVQHTEQAQVAAWGFPRYFCNWLFIGLYLGKVKRELFCWLRGRVAPAKALPPRLELFLVNLDGLGGSLAPQAFENGHNWAGVFGAGIGPLRELIGGVEKIAEPLFLVRSNSAQVFSRANATQSNSV
jgi:hypothetical protein